MFVEKVDVVSGVGYDRAAELGDWVKEHHELRRVVTNLAVLDFGGPDHRMRLVSVHPGVTVDDVVAATGFELVLADDVRGARGPPTPEETRGDRAPRPARACATRKCPADDALATRLHTRFCDLVGVEYPIVQTGMGWVAGRAASPPRPRPPAASASSPAPPWTSASCAARSPT